MRLVLRWPGLASLLSSRPSSPQGQLMHSLPRGPCRCPSIRVLTALIAHTGRPLLITNSFFMQLLLLYSLTLSFANSLRAKLFCLFIHASLLQIFDQFFCPSVPAGRKRHTKQPLEVQTSGSRGNPNVIKSYLDTQRGKLRPRNGK